ncbi:putative O-methyltransferase [Daldinia sp. FL1419]|nr:putative O-methyltransferase [Daldinia sp. FL1419]
MPSTTPESLILRKAREILGQAEDLVRYLEGAGFQEPNFTKSSPPHPANREYDTIRIKLTEAAEDLIFLAKGPMQWIRTYCVLHHDFAAWQIALRFKLFTIVPLEGTISVSDMAAVAKMDGDRLGRIMKLLATQRCFREVDEDVFEHTSLSAFIARNKDIESSMALQADEMFEAVSMSATAIESAPYTSDISHTAFTMRFGSPPYQWYTANSKRSARFASAMAGLVQMNQDTTEIRDNFPWANLSNKTIVDVGGGSGHTSIYLATQFPDLKFIVQDINPTMLSEGPKRREFESVGERISFMQYDFLQPQQIHNAGIFLLRQIIHNYNDEMCIKILGSLVPALEKCPPETSVLINDVVLPEANTVPKVYEHHLRQLDIIMLNVFAGKERTLKEFAHLLDQTDERLKIIQVHGQGVMQLVEIKLVR